MTWTISPCLKEIRLEQLLKFPANNDITSCGSLRDPSTTTQKRNACEGPLAKVMPFVVLSKLCITGLEEGNSKSQLVHIFQPPTNACSQALHQAQEKMNES